MEKEQKIYYLEEYNWLCGKLVKTNKKTYKIVGKDVNGSLREKNFPKEKCAFPEEEVCVVWEKWKGVNGRGGYRVEKKLYPEYRIPAKSISRQHVGFRGNSGRNGRVEEDRYGNIDPFFAKRSSLRSVV